MSLAPLIGLAILAAGLAFAQQNVPAPAPAGPATAAPATGAEGAGDDGATAEKNAEETPAKPVAAKGSPQRFEPTEKVRPDFDVAFPVDI